MSALVVAERRMQFCAGPEQYTFRACAEHLPLLEAGDVSCFLRLVGVGVQPVEPPEDPEDGCEGCYFCREG